eukprot:g4584.t1
MKIDDQENVSRIRDDPSRWRPAAWTDLRLMMKPLPERPSPRWDPMKIYDQETRDEPSRVRYYTAKAECVCHVVPSKLKVKNSIRIHSTRSRTLPRTAHLLDLSGLHPTYDTSDKLIYLQKMRAAATGSHRDVLSLGLNFQQPL